MKDQEIKEIYNLIKGYHKTHLEKHGVKLPKLQSKGRYTKDALTLVYLCRDYPNTHIVSKDELTAFIRTFYPDNTNDVQQARHLAAQKGWYILSGTRKDNASLQLKAGEYKLESLESHYPGFSHQRRENIAGDDYFEELKKSYGYRCATCGSKEGEPSFHWPNVTTVLHKAHMNPNKPLEIGNIIPQCEKCNRPDRNNWIYDQKGRVVGIASEKVIDKCTKEIRKKIYERLKNEFEGK